MQIDQVNNAITLCDFMEEIWDMPSRPNPSGGVTIFQHPGYTRWHNAVMVARLSGAKRTGGTLLGGEYAQTFEWPDGTRAIIAGHGGAMRLSTRKRHEHKG